MIKTTLLQNGEYAGICTLEITSIPHISILESEYSNKTKEEILFKYKVDMQALISELYQNYKLMIIMIFHMNCYGLLLL